jgi:hypothetical protein
MKTLQILTVAAVLGASILAAPPPVAGSDCFRMCRHPPGSLGSTVQNPARGASPRKNRAILTDMPRGTRAQGLPGRCACGRLHRILSETTTGKVRC